MKRKIANSLVFLISALVLSIVSILYSSNQNIHFLVLTILYIAELAVSARILKVLKTMYLEFLNGPARYCRGKGAEIGSCGVHTVKDSILIDMVRDFSSSKPYKVDYIADAHHLPKIENASLDYVCASHVLEHLTNPIKAILEWMRILKPGGILWLKIPDKRKTFDRGRTRTGLAHLVEDFQNDVPADDPAHFNDHNKNFLPPHDDKHPYIHNHIWVSEDILELFKYINEHSSPLQIIRYSENTCRGAQDFWIVVKKKIG